MEREPEVLADVRSFLRAFQALLVELPDSGNPEIESERRVVAKLLRDVGQARCEDRPAIRMPVCRFLDAAHKVPEEENLCNLVKASRPLCERTVWRNKYANLPGMEGLFENFAFCDFIGPDGWLQSRNVTLGLTMLGPGTEYPFHQHPARELYLLLSGSSYWAVDFEPYGWKCPGTWMLHKELQPHAMKTEDLPMLAVSVWRGDIETGSRFCENQEA